MKEGKGFSPELPASGAPSAPSERQGLRGPPVDGPQPVTASRPQQEVRLQQDGRHITLDSALATVGADWGPCSLSSKFFRFLLSRGKIEYRVTDRVEVRLSDGSEATTNGNSGRKQ